MALGPVLKSVNSNSYKHQYNSILSGDRNQFGAIDNSWKSVVVGGDPLWHSDLLFDLVGGSRIELLECQRSDKALFDAYSCLAQNARS